MVRGADEKKGGPPDRLRGIGFRITPLRIEDVEEISAIERESFASPWSKDSFREIALSQLYKAVVARGNSKEIMGYLVYYTAADEGHVMNVVANPKFRRMGVAKTMLDWVHEELRRSGVKNVYLELRRSNYAAYRLYKKNGYVYTGLRKEYYADNQEDAIVMKKVLV